MDIDTYYLFPTHAGVILELVVSDGQSYPIPCACGDDSIRVKRIAFVAPYFRVMQCLISWAVIVSLFPAHAGVIPAPREPTPSTAPIPCVCGGVPPVAAAPVPVAVYFPAYAGVIPYPLCAQAFSHLIPRDAGARTIHSFVYFMRFECFLSSPTLC